MICKRCAGPLFRSYPFEAPACLWCGWDRYEVPADIRAEFDERREGVVNERGQRQAGGARRVYCRRVKL